MLCQSAAKPLKGRFNDYYVDSKWNRSAENDIKFYKLLKMKFTEKEFIQEVETLYNGEIEVVGKFKGLTHPILLRDKYGVVKVDARSALTYKPSIISALNKTKYFMNMLKEKYYHIYSLIEPESEYLGMNEKMIFNTQYGLVSINPGSLISGHTPNIRSAINRKKYFKNMLKYIYGDKYKFIITNTDRSKGSNYLICPIHGKVEFDNESIFLGNGCKKCSTTNAPKTLLYLIKLYNETESFYKIGISGYLLNGKIKRYRQYKSLGYNVKEIKIIEFKNELELREYELKLKHIIKEYLYTPKNWNYNKSTECFSEEILEILLTKINSLYHYDIV